MDADGGPHTYVGAVSPSAGATVSYLWAWHAKTAGKWMPRAAQIKSRHYKYESEQLAGRSLWSCGGRDDGSKLGGKLSPRGPSSAVLTVGLHFCSACRGFAEPSWPVPTPTASLASSLDEPVPDSQRLKEPPPCEGRGRCRRASTVQVRGSHLTKADLGGHPQRLAQPTSPDRNDPTSPEVQLECLSESWFRTA